MIRSRASPTYSSVCTSKQARAHAFVRITLQGTTRHTETRRNTVTTASHIHTSVPVFKKFIPEDAVVNGHAHTVGLHEHMDKRVEETVEKVHRAEDEAGTIFITLPDYRELEDEEVEAPLQASPEQHPSMHSHKEKQ